MAEVRLGLEASLTCEVMQFNVNQNLEEVISAEVTLKPNQSSSGSGMNVGSVDVSPDHR